jgi:hypothetical protein
MGSSCWLVLAMALTPVTHHHHLHHHHHHHHASLKIEGLRR